jgi:cardiolipin synthase A/B
MNEWSKTSRWTVDRRDEALPPTWCPRRSSASASAPPITLDGVLRPEASGVLERALVSAIDGAREVVVAAAFLLADAAVEQALLRAAKRKIRVYLLLATETRLDKELRAGSDFEQRALDDHKKMLGALAGWALIRSAPSYHAKANLVDPHHGGPGFLLTANLTHEALTRNEELALSLTPEESKAALAQLSWAMWEAAEHELLEPGRVTSAAKPLGRVPKPAHTGAVVGTLGERGPLHAAALALVTSATKRIVVASYGWDADHPVVLALCERARAGVEVTVLARVRPAAMPALLALAEAGARVVGFRWLHAKALVVDGGAALVMSANFQRYGLDEGIELGVRLDGRRAAAVRAVLDAWSATAPHELRLAPRLGELVGDLHVWEAGKLRDETAVANAALSLEPVTAASADDLDAARPALPAKGVPLAHRVELTREVRAPRLAPKATELAPKPDLASAGGPSLFREPSGRLVVAVRTPGELPRARELSTVAGAKAIVVREAAR